MGQETHATELGTEPDAHATSDGRQLGYVPRDHPAKISVDGREVGFIVRHSLFAGVAQLVEHHLAKVDVESSNLFARSSLRQAYGWQATRLRPTLQDCAEVSADLSAIASATAEALAKADLSSGNREST